MHIFVKSTCIVTMLATILSCGGSRTSSSNPSDGNATGSKSSSAGAPSKEALIAMVRSAQISSKECSSGPLGEVYRAQAETLKNEADSMKVAFQEDASCKPAAEEDMHRLALPTPGAVYYCTVSASPDWNTYNAREKPEEEGGTSFMVGFALDASGAIMPASLHCVAPG